MANTTTKNKKKEKASQPEETATISAERKRQVRLGFGIFFMLTGIFICFSIISYCFTWRTDQDSLIRTTGIWDFLLHDRSPVANWGGRLGAALSHVLVFKGAGIASLVIGLGIAAIGMHMIYGKKAVPYFRYMRWLSIILLLAAPIFTYLIPTSSFALGGALGKIAIEYLNGLLGLIGTGMLLLATLLFFAFAVFALDISPLLNRMRAHAGKVAEALTPAPVAVNEADNNNGSFSESANETDLAPAETMNTFGNQLNYGAGAAPVSSMLPDNNKQWDMAVVEKPAEEEDGAITEDEEVEQEEEPTEDEAAYNEYIAQKEADANEQRKATTVEDLDFSVVIKQEETPVIKHGDHISIADNEPFAPEESLRSYQYPTLDLLEDRVQEAISMNKEELDRNKDQIINTLRSFGIEIKTITATVGPTVTLYEIVPQEGVRISKIRNLEDDIALNLAALGIRIIAPIPGKGTIGIEVPNANKQIVSMRALLASDKFVNSKMSLPIALGKKIDNENYIVDLATMPHLLMAGATGQGKSVGINAILVSLLYKKHPSQLKFVMVDPKKVELSIYRKIEKHFLAKLPNETEPIITDTKKAIYTLKALCDEMDNRYELLKEAGARNIKEYNEKIVNRKIKNPAEHKYLPFIVLVIDEFADLIMTAGKEVEMPIARLAQLARAVGIHLIIATQRPSVNVITGTIKANFPARIAFKVSAKVDSRTILDAGGAEQLIGRGDMLVSHGSELLRLQCAFVDTPEVEEIVNFIGDQRGYPSAHHLPEPEMDDEDGGGKSVDLKNRDKLFEDCARLVVQMQSGSTSNLQRRLNLGYNRAGRIMDQLEAAGVVGPTNGSKPREVYYKTEGELEQYLESLE
ncbi:MAG: cell division protein FtsK [Flavipsychrobacter sp.]|jgi:S-DNA-T family DNA segregation ATPase FtsK/SpoIIIE|nr:cell division protein FtsK [Flavipsychrobacter sp.]